MKYLDWSFPSKSLACSLLALFCFFMQEQGNQAFGWSKWFPDGRAGLELDRAGLELERAGLELDGLQYWACSLLRLSATRGWTKGMVSLGPLLPHPAVFPSQHTHGRLLPLAGCSAPWTLWWRWPQWWRWWRGQGSGWCRGCECTFVQGNSRHSKACAGLLQERKKEGNAVSAGPAAWLAAITTWPEGHVLYKPRFSVWENWLKQATWMAKHFYLEPSRTRVGLSNLLYLQQGPPQLWQPVLSVLTALSQARGQHFHLMRPPSQTRKGEKQDGNETQSHEKASNPAKMQLQFWRAEGRSHWSGLHCASLLTCWCQACSS